MSIHSNVTEQDLNILRKLAEQQNEQRAIKIKNRILKQTLDVKLAESLSPITKKLDVNNDSTKLLGELVKKSEVEFGNTQTLAIENITGTQSLRDALAFMKQSNNFFKLEERPDGRVYWNGVRIKPVRENSIDVIGREYDVTPCIQEFFIKTGSTTKSLNNNETETVYNILKDVGFYKTRHMKGLKAARMRDALHDLPKVIDQIRNHPLPKIENVEDSSDLEGQGLKFIIPSNLIDNYTRLEVLPGLKLSGHTDTLTEASTLIDELYKRGEIQNKQQYQNGLIKFSTQ